MSFDSWFSQPFGVTWRSALVRLPRAVPSEILHLTIPDGPQPYIIDLASRAKHRIPTYVFIPSDLTPEEADKIPVIIDFHGGGFYLGSCLEQAPFCSLAARKLRTVVISVDYRLGPKDVFPAAIEDAEDVLRSVLDENFDGYDQLRDAIQQRVQESRKGHTDGVNPLPLRIRLDRSRIAISGFSSGGNLALNLALSVAEMGEDPAWPSPIPLDHPHPVPLLLFYPSFDARQLPSERNRPPELPKPSGFWSEVSDKLVPSYLPRERAHEPRASPGLADLAGLHPKARMILILPGIDDLAEQSEVWVKKVQEGGRSDDLKIERFPYMKHGWTQMPESWLNEDEKRSRLEVFMKAGAFAKDIWQGKDVDEAGNILMHRSMGEEWRYAHYDQMLEWREANVEGIIHKSAHPEEARLHLQGSVSSLESLSSSEPSGSSGAPASRTTTGSSRRSRWKGKLKVSSHQ